MLLLHFVTFFGRIFFKEIQKLFGPEIYQFKKISSLVLLKNTKSSEKCKKNLYFWVKILTEINRLKKILTG